MHDHDDIDEILSRAFPQGSRLIRLEGGGRLIYTAARDLIGNPDLAVEVLGPRGAMAVADALDAVGQRHTQVAVRMRQLAQDALSRASDARPVPAGPISDTGCQTE